VQKYEEVHEYQKQDDADTAAIATACKYDLFRTD